MTLACTLIYREQTNYGKTSLAKLIKNAYPLKNNWENFTMSDWFPTTRSNAILLAEWALSGAPTPPPPTVKQLQIGSYIIGSGYTRFVETGTYLGWTTKAIADLGVEIDTIELADLHYNRAIEHFKSNKSVHIHLGDSSKLLPEILKSIDVPAVFWLDGHFSGLDTALGDSITPIEQELTHIKNHHVKNHIIFIDDIRLFGDHGYPPLEPMRELAESINTEFVSRVANDSLIVALPHIHEEATKNWRVTAERMLPPL